MPDFTLTPSQQTNQNTTGSYSGGQSGSGNNYQNYQYSPAQQGLQNQLGGAWGQFLQGNVPSGFTNNPNLVNAFTTAFNQNAPSMAFQGGAGSPQMQSNYAMGLQQLLANQYNQGVSNYANALQGAGGFGLTPLGQNTGYTNNQTNFANNRTGLNQTISQPLSLLSLLMGGGGFGIQ